MNFWVLLLCRLFNIPSIQEVCEWWPETGHSNFFTNWMYKRIMFCWSAGALPISHLIEKRIRIIAGQDYPLLRIPVLVDPEEKKHALGKSFGEAQANNKILLWCGVVDGYKRDVFFLIKAVAQLESGQAGKTILRIVGPCSPLVKEELSAYAKRQGLKSKQIHITGFVTEKQLWSYCVEAYGLLMPLWNDDRSNTRFPTKLGQYVASGRPIVTALSGEIKYFLTENTAFFYSAGESKSLAATLDRMLNESELAEKIAELAIEKVLPELDFRENASKIAVWFNKIHQTRNASF